MGLTLGAALAQMAVSQANPIHLIVKIITYLISSRSGMKQKLSIHSRAANSKQLANGDRQAPRRVSLLKNSLSMYLECARSINAPLGHLFNR